MSDTSGSTSTDTSPDEIVFTTKINGQEKPVTRAQAIRYAQQVGSMAEQAAALSKRQEDLEAYDRLVAGMERDPEGTMAALASAAGGSFTPKGAKAPASAVDDDDDEDPIVADLKAQIAELSGKFGQVYGELSGFKAQTYIEKEIADLKAANPKMTDDEFRAAVSKVTVYNGLPLKEAYRLVQMEAIENSRGADHDSEDRTKLPITPGSGTPANRVGDDKDKLDYTKDQKALLKDSWAKTAAKLGISPDQ